MTSQLISTPVFPATVCHKCQAYLVWRNAEVDPDEKAWMECRVCGKTWQPDDVNYSLADQKEVILGVMAAIENLSLKAIARVDPQQRQEQSQFDFAQRWMQKGIDFLFKDIRL